MIWCEMLTERRGRILRSLIQEYTSTANPVSSESVARSCGLGVSAATIRNEMVQLEEEGYVTQPHTSAGRVPSPKGYRYYVEILLEEWELARAEQELIRRQFDQARKEIEEWVHLTASVLSRMLGSVAIVTFPRVAEPRLKLVELISLREFLALLLLIFKNASLRQRTVSFDEIVSQEELNAISRRLTGACEGLTGTEIRSKADEFTPAEGRVTETLLEVMEEEGGEGLGDSHFEGLSRILSQPEFATTERAMLLVEVLEERNLLRSILSQALGDEKLRVFIGGETLEPVMHDFSVVMGQYGLPGQASGVIGVIGPTRMPYERAFSAVRFLSGTMSELLGELYG
ncbi:heat-inducible transcriptional repressor HrcA [Dehalococcoidia bacterium]|nr:heat-inducible transcriptional repressor HrcA [Dehalococcoidia bacterium]